MVSAHEAKIIAPYYADAGDGTLLHRYLDDQFIARFNQEAAAGKLTGTSAQSWRASDRFGSNKDKVSLRLPIHRTFYLVACEVCCDRAGNPALDPARIISAGMVVRKGAPQSYRTWQLREGAAIGWRAGRAADVGQEPDHYRRLLNRGLVQPRVPEPPYSGEQTHRLHSLLVKARDAQGNLRNHTLLYGYLPLGGSVEAELASDVESQEAQPASTTVSATGQLAEHEWPFGSWDGVSAEPVCRCSGNLAEVATDVCDHFVWQQQTGLQIDNGVPTRAFAGFLRTLLERNQIYDASIAANEALRTLLQQIFFYNSVSVNNGVAGNASLAGLEPQSSLLSYIEANYEALIEWYAELDYENNQRLKQDQAPLSPLPQLPGTSRDLYILSTQAASLREQLVLRAEQAEQLVEQSLPLPRYTQGRDDMYFVCPFVRYKDCCNKEQIVWGPPSEIFRVASPLDPEAVRPTVIQLPELSDIRRGFAKGVTFLTPKSMADALETIAPDMEFKKQNKKNRLEACLGFSISFSIPIITICAMILLMIILNLLNIFLRWLPWAILKLPRKC